MERPLIGNCRRGFLFASVAAFVFWVALIYVFNRDVAVTGGFGSGIDMVADPDPANFGEALVHPNVVERSVDNTLETVGGGGGSDEEPGDRTGSGEVFQQPPGDVDVVERNDSSEEPVRNVGVGDDVVEKSAEESSQTGGGGGSNEEPDGRTGSEEEARQPPRDFDVAGQKDSKEEPDRSVGAEDDVVEKSVEGGSNEEPDDRTRTGEEARQPPRDVDVVGGSDSDEEAVRKVGMEDVKKSAENSPQTRVGGSSNEESDNRTGAEEEGQQSTRKDTEILGRSGLKEEPVRKVGKKEEVLKPLRNIARRSGSDEDPVHKNRTEDQDSRNHARNDVEGLRSSEEPVHKGSTKATAEEPVEEEEEEDDPDSCEGRYIFVQILPRRFHVDLLRKCKSLSAWTDMCETLSNAGLGPELPKTEKALSNTGWFSTNQFSLEVIFHNRMKQYKCLTNDSSVASAIYVPYYAGLDVAQYLWHTTEYRDTGPRELVRFLRARPEWKRMYGRDHFLVAGRISWDFRRETFNDSDWGTNLLVLPEVKQMTSLVLESTLIPAASDFAVPYPTYFHPASDAEVIYWQDKMRRLRRPFLFSFAGARRPNLPNSIRDEIIDQCQASKGKCKLLECYSRGNTCYRPVNLIKLFQESVFCLQPQGDSYTRRSTFDSILTGCVPVFFHPGSAYDQYKWHLPKDHTQYSVFIPEGQVKDGNVSIEKVLSSIPRRKVEAMQREVIELIPKIVYADPRSELETFQDAFDLTVKGVLKRIRKIRKGT